MIYKMEGMSFFVSPAQDEELRSCGIWTLSVHVPARMFSRYIDREQVEDDVELEMVCLEMLESVASRCSRMERIGKIEINRQE